MQNRHGLGGAAWRRGGGPGGPVLQGYGTRMC